MFVFVLAIWIISLFGVLLENTEMNFSSLFLGFQQSLSVSYWHLEITVYVLWIHLTLLFTVTNYEFNME